MSSLNIFVVDDDEDFAKTTATLLSIEGHNVEIANSGEEALLVVREKDFDVIFMDVKMPGMNGVECYFEIQKLKPATKMIMMTAYTVEELLQKAIDGGVFATVRKPFNIDDVLVLLEKISLEGLIVIADDDPDFVQSVNNLLVEEGYKVIVANTGKAAVSKVLENTVDFLILDLKLPLLSGLEVYLELKKLNCLVPTIIVTAHEKEEMKNIDELKMLEVTGILVKPFDPKVLLELIRQ